MSALSALVNRPLALELGWHGAIRNYLRLASVLVAPFLIFGIGTGVYWLFRQDSAAVVAGLTSINVAIGVAAGAVLLRFSREARSWRQERAQQRTQIELADTEKALVDAMQTLIGDDHLDDERLHAVERAIISDQSAIEALAAERVHALIDESVRLRVDTPLFKVGEVGPTIWVQRPDHPVVPGSPPIEYGSQYFEAIRRIQRLIDEAQQRHGELSLKTMTISEAAASARLREERAAAQRRKASSDQ